MSWLGAAGLLFGDWGTSRLYVLGLALFYAGRTSVWLILAMSLLILGVAWAYSRICALYPDGGGVYTAARRVSRTLAVVGALLLFADYTVTASLSVLDGFHYFGLPLHHHEQIDAGGSHEDPDAGNRLDPDRPSPRNASEKLLALDSPGFWAVVAIAGLGVFNMTGPGRTSRFALFAALGMVFITLLIVAFALPRIDWHALPQNLGKPDFSHPFALWTAFVSIVLALSGVEAIANLTGTMREPVAQTARRAIWVVAAEVALFNVVLAVCMLAIKPINRDHHLADMAAFLSARYVGVWGEWAVRIVGGFLLLSAGNTAIAGMTSIQYLMARDGELPQAMTRLNSFGVPTLPAILAAGVPILVLFVSHDLDRLASLYAIGVVGAITINISLCAFHPELNSYARKIPMLLLGILLFLIWITLAYVKRDALIFVGIVLAIGLTARFISRRFAKGPPDPVGVKDLLSHPDAEIPEGSRLLLGVFSSQADANAALELARKDGATLVVCFLRFVRVTRAIHHALVLENDAWAVRALRRIQSAAKEMKVPVLFAYDTAMDPAPALAGQAAKYHCKVILLNAPRSGRLRGVMNRRLLKRLHSILPAEITVKTLPSTAAAS